MSFENVYSYIIMTTIMIWKNFIIFKTSLPPLHSIPSPTSSPWQLLICHPGYTFSRIYYKWKYNVCNL